MINTLLVLLGLGTFGYFVFKFLGVRADSKLKEYLKKIAELELEKIKTDAKIEDSVKKIDEIVSGKENAVNENKEKPLENVIEDLNNRYNRK